jgi:hypothetical protein
MRIIGLSLAVTLLACGKGDASGSVTKPPPTPVPPASTSQTVAVRLLGINPPGSVQVQMASVDLVVDGHAISGQVDTKQIDLGNDQSAWAVMTFALPSSAQKVAINLHFQPLGTVVRDGNPQVLDLQGAPISFTADAAQMRTRSKVVFEIDLARSLVDQGSQVYLLPDFTVSY